MDCSNYYSCERDWNTWYGKGNNEILKERVLFSRFYENNNFMELYLSLCNEMSVIFFFFFKISYYFTINRFWKMNKNWLSLYKSFYISLNYLSFSIVNYRISIYVPYLFTIFKICIKFIIVLENNIIHIRRIIISFFFFSFPSKLRRTRLMKFIARYYGLGTWETKHVGLTDQTHGNFALLGEK